MPSHGDEVAGLHPVDVGVHRFTRNLRWVFRVDVERRHLIHGTDEKLVTQQEFTHAVVQLRALHFRATNIKSAEREASLDVPHHGRLDVLAVTRQQWRAIRIGERAQCFEGFIRIGEIRRRGLDGATQRAKHRQRSCQHRRDARIHRQTAEVGAPGHPRTAKVAVQWQRELCCIIVHRGRCPCISTCNNTEHQRHILNRARHRPEGAHAAPRARDRPGRNATERWPETNDIVEISGIAQGAAKIAAVRNRHHAAG